jgi:hypothetical protein
LQDGVWQSLPKIPLHSGYRLIMKIYWIEGKNHPLIDIRNIKKSVFKYGTVEASIIFESPHFMLCYVKLKMQRSECNAAMPT